MSGFEVRIALQQSRFTLIEQAADFSDDDMSRVTRQLINTRLDVLEQNWMKFQEDHEYLCHSSSVTLRDHNYMKTRVFERCQAFYVYSRAKLLDHRDDFDSMDRRSRSVVSDTGATASLLPRSALPRINLPTFSGDYESWRSFHDLFVSLIRDNTDLSNVEKMHYLKTCVTGDASRMISNLSISGNNFAIVWEMLVSRYENKRFLITAQLDRITNLKPLKTKSAKGLSSFLTTISESIGALRALGCSVHYWDPALLHIFVKLLDQDTREAWEVNLGSSSNYPTYLQFEDFLIGRTRAMENLQFNASTSTTNKEHYISFADGRRSKVAHVATSYSNQNSTDCPLCHTPHYLG